MSEAVLNCEVCSSQELDLVPVDSGLRLSLQKRGATQVPNKVCRPCLKSLRKQISSGAQLADNKEARLNEASELWRGRLGCVRLGRSFFANKIYLESASAYEKYIKILEIAYNTTLFEMSPSTLREKPKEITVLCTVFWDLMLIYDAEPSLAGKQNLIGKKLAEFCKYTKIYSNIVRKAEVEGRKAKNPKAFKDFLDACDVKPGRCFIANAVFEGHDNPTVLTLCQFRDQILDASSGGRQFISWYYRVSPAVANRIDHHSTLKVPLSLLLRLVAAPLPWVFPLQASSEALTWGQWLPSKIKKFKKNIIR